MYEIMHLSLCILSVTASIKKCPLAQYVVYLLRAHMRKCRVRVQAETGPKKPTKKVNLFCNVLSQCARYGAFDKWVQYFLQQQQDDGFIPRMNPRSC